MNMKNNILKTLAVVCVALSIVSCSKDELSDTSVISKNQIEETDLDRWLKVNFLTPYNINFKYRYEMKESDLNYYTVPADYDCSVIAAHLVKYLCMESYDEVAGIDFTRSYFPKMFFLIGDFEYRNNGTIILGTAEGGKKILLSGINWIRNSLGNAELMNTYYIKVIHHEFTHILNQTVDYPAEFKEITGSGYVADSWSVEPYVTDYLKNGFISSYAQHSHQEDFAEMMSFYVTKSPEWWAAQLEEAGEPGASYIKSKLDIVRDYLQENFNIDIDELRDVIIRRQEDVVSGRLDLSDLTIK